MHITRKIDRAFQWAGEKMGGEAKTGVSEDFKMLETEMALRYDGMERLHKSMNAYVKWLGRRNETFEDKEKGLPASYMGRTMLAHGEEFAPDSEFGNCLIAMGQANERLAGLQEAFVADSTTLWLESLERSLAMMKEYQAARKKLENRRLAYDASMGKYHKARREDYRLEEELRTAKAKYDEASEDVMRRMQDIRDAEADSVQDLTSFMDAELGYHEKCAEELRRVRSTWPAGPGRSTIGGNGNGYGYGGGAPGGGGGIGGGSGGGMMGRRSAAPSVRSRSSTGQSLAEQRLSRTLTNRSTHSNGCDDSDAAVALPIRSTTNSRYSGIGSQKQSLPVESPARPTIGSRSSTFQGGASLAAQQQEREERVGIATGRIMSSGNYGLQSAASTPAGSSLNVSSLRGQLRPVGRAMSNDVFTDRSNAGMDDDMTTASGSVSPELWGHNGDNRSASPATSYGSLSTSTSNVVVGGKKAPPPPPPSRSKKPPPPVPMKRETGC